MAEEKSAPAAVGQHNGLTPEMLPGWRLETLHPGFAQAIEIGSVLLESRGEHVVEVVETPRFGKMLLLDGAVQTTEADEFIYHEMIAHTPLFAHGSAKRVLIIGGGDGGVLREVVKHRSVEKVTMVEIDRSVVDLATTHFPKHSDGAFDDPRFDLVIDDGAAYVGKFKRKSFDVIIVDSTDPQGPGAALYTSEFYANCKARLAKGGIMVAQAGTPFLQGDELADVSQKLGALFEDASAYLITVPTYVGGPMALAWASDAPRRRQVSAKTLRDRFSEADFATRCYTPDMHLAAFALPPYVSALMR